MKRFLWRIALITIGLVAGSITFANEQAAVNNQNEFARMISQISGDTPIVMLNMLRFRDLADYPEGGPKVSGEEAYGAYRAAASKLVAEVGGGPVWSGLAKASLIAPNGAEWDEVFLVRYPSIQAFLKMISSDAYQQIVHHRSAALADSRLIATVESEK